MSPTYQQCVLCPVKLFDWAGGDVGVAMLWHFRIDQAHRKAAGIKK